MKSKSRKVISVDTLLDGGIRPWTEICHSILLRLHRIFLQIRWTWSNGEFCERLEFPSAKTSVKQTCADKCVYRFLVLVDVSQEKNSNLVHEKKTEKGTRRSTKSSSWKVLNQTDLSNCISYILAETARLLK